MQERRFAVAVRDGENLFLWFSIRRASGGDIYWMVAKDKKPPERREPHGLEWSPKDWKKWNPHASHHQDGAFHHKSSNIKMTSERRQKPDGNFKGTENLCTTGIARGEPQAIGVICNPAEFSEVMEIPYSIISPKRYETLASIDVAEPESQAIITPGCEILAERALKDATPWILVTVFNSPHSS